MVFISSLYVCAASHFSFGGLVDLDEVSYIESSDPHLLDKYIEIREKTYRDRLELKEFSGKYENFDSNEEWKALYVYHTTNPRS